MIEHSLGGREARCRRDGVPESATDANGRTTRRKLDPFGRTVELTDPDGVVFTTTYARCGSTCAAVDGVAPAMKVETDSSITPKVTRYLDQLGRVVRVRTESFAGPHDILEDVRHDARGRVLRRSAPYFANAGTAPNASYEYDDLDRMAKETRPDGGETAYAYAAGTDGATTVTATEKAYANGTLTATIATVTTYNLLGEVASVTEASGTADAVTTAYAYDASGLPLTVTVGGKEVAVFAHDAAGNRTSATDPNSGATTFTHTALGQTLTARNALAQTTTYGYDDLGRLTSRSDPDGKAFWTYDGTNGKGMLHQRCRGGTTLTGCGGTPDFLETLAYGSDARPSSATTVIRADGQTARSHARSFTYDGSGCLLTESHPSEITTLREYNARGYLAAVKENTTGKVLERYTAADAFGSVTAVTHGNGAKTARDFDGNTGRMTGTETTHGGGASKTVAQDFGFEWWGDRPATHLTWAEAAAYATWLSERTGNRYRLPSEAEWEWAARALTGTAYPWGNDVDGQRALCAGCGTSWPPAPWVAPTGSYPPNPWGLFDMHGNAAEWTADCWHPDHVGAPADGSTRADGDCSRRVVRGGSYDTPPRAIRSAARVGKLADERYLDTGFRVLRELRNVEARAE